MNRITDKDINVAVSRLGDLTGFGFGYGIGKLYTEYSYDSVRLVRMVNLDGAIKPLTGFLKRSELFLVLHGMCDILREYKYE